MPVSTLWLPLIHNNAFPGFTRSADLVINSRCGQKRGVFIKSFHKSSDTRSMIPATDSFPENLPHTAIWVIRSFYIFSAYAILIVRFIPDLNARYLDYGPRSASERIRKINDSVLPMWLRIQLDPALDWLAELTVPHSWFAHFYLVSSACSAIWLWRTGYFLWPSVESGKDVLVYSWNQRSFLALFLLQLQGLRRLYESLVVSKPSPSRMWVGHYAIGIAFYVFTNVAVWVEPALENRSDQKPWSTDRSDPMAIANTIRIVACTVFFCYFSFKQYIVHKYLASLKQYQVPNHPIFVDTNLICPHYNFEVNIYLVLSILTARDTRIFNVTMLCASFFVALNLGVTADMTQKWQLRKFPKQRVEIAARRRMFSSIW